MPGFGKREDKPSPPIGAMEELRWGEILMKKIDDKAYRVSLITNVERIVAIQQLQHDSEFRQISIIARLNCRRDVHV